MTYMKKPSLKKNSLFNIVYKILNMVFPLVSASYLSHVLLADGIGRVNYAQNIAQYFVLIAPLGITNYGTREIAKLRDSKAERVHLFSELFFLNALSTVLCTLFYYTLIENMKVFEADIILYRIVGLSIVFNVFNVDWYYQGKEEYVYIATRSIVVKALSLIAIICFVKDRSDYSLYAFIFVMGIAGNYVLNIINLFREGIRISFRGVQIFRHLKSTVILLFSNIAIEIYILFDTTMLGVMCTDEVVGYYTNSQRVLRIVVSLIGAINGVLLPRLSYYHGLNKQDECNNLVNIVTMIIFFISLPCGIGIFIVAPELILTLFGSSFLPAITTLRLGMPIVLVLAYSNLFGTQVLLTYKQEKLLLLSVVIGAISNIVLNCALIPTYENNGAIVASVLSETIVTTVTFLFSKKYIDITMSGSFIRKTILAVVIMSISVFMVNCIIDSNIIKLIIEILVGVFAYFISTIILKNPLIEVVRNGGI